MKDYITDQNFYIAHNTDYENRIYNPHSHDEIEIYIHISGGKHFFVDGVTYDIKKRDVIIFGSNQIHQILKNPNEIYERYTIVYKKEFLMSLGADYIEINNLISDIVKLKGNVLNLSEGSFDILLNMLESYKTNKNIANNLYKLSKFLEIIIFILEKYEKNEVMEDRYVNNPLVGDIIKKIDLFYTDCDFTVARLAEMVHISKCYMCDVFKKNTGITILNYLNHKRIIAAKAMLTEGVSIVSCADSLGFGSYNDFIRVFKKVTGDTPKRYFMQNIGRERL